MNEFLEIYISVPFILCVLFGTETANKYIPLLKKWPNQIVTLIVASLMVLVFFVIESPENVGTYQIKILVSFLGTVGMYDFIVKPIKNLIERK